MTDVLLLEDYAPSRELLMIALQRALQQVNVYQAGTLRAARDLIAKQRFDLALLDLNLPDGSGTEILQLLKETSPDTRCVIATGYDDEQHLYSCLSMGAEGYLLKDEPLDEIERHLQGLLLGCPPISSRTAQQLINFYASATHHSALEVHLTEREVDVLKLIARGASRKLIARELNISIHTANDHVKALYRKLNVSNNVEAARVAMEHGLCIHTP